MNNGYDQYFFQDGYKLGSLAVSSQESFAESIRTMYEAIDQTIESLLQIAEKQEIKIDCKKGCDRCCYQPVFASNYEISYLYDYVRQHLSYDDQADIFRKAKEKYNYIKDMEPDVLKNSKHACSLLKDGSCIAYEARPVACRIYLSSKVQSCEYFFRFPDDPDEYPALMEFPLQAGRMMNEGFDKALKERGIVTTEITIEEGLLNFIKQKLC